MLGRRERLGEAIPPLLRLSSRSARVRVVSVGWLRRR
jgi:hypothetical protein